MAWSFSSGRPVYLQIAERLTKSVLSGEFKAGEQIPTVRQLALVAAVNPNTIQHAFVELEKDGLIISKGTSGRFVTEDEAVIDQCRKKLAEKTVKSFVKDMKHLALTKEQVISLIEEVEE